MLAGAGGYEEADERTAALVESALGTSPFSGSVFVSINHLRDKLKLLAWDHTGFIVWYKRLEKACFVWPLRSSSRHRVY